MEERNDGFGRDARAALLRGDLHLPAVRARRRRLCRGGGGLGLTVSYWRSLDAIRAWKEQVDHQETQREGRKTWYDAFKLRISLVERDYGFER